MKYSTLTKILEEKYGENMKMDFKFNGKSPENAIVHAQVINLLVISGVLSTEDLKRAEQIEKKATLGEEVGRSIDDVIRAFSNSSPKKEIEEKLNYLREKIKGSPLFKECEEEVKGFYDASKETVADFLKEVKKKAQECECNASGSIKDLEELIKQNSKICRVKVEKFQYLLTKLEDRKAWEAKLLEGNIVLSNGKVKVVFKNKAIEVLEINENVMDAITAHVFLEEEVGKDLFFKGTQFGVEFKNKLEKERKDLEIKSFKDLF